MKCAAVQQQSFAKTLTWKLDNKTGAAITNASIAVPNAVVFGNNYSNGGSTETRVTVYYDDVNATTPVSAPVPEPSSLLALGTGIMGLFGFMRKRSA